MLQRHLLARCTAGSSFSGVLAVQWLCCQCSGICNRVPAFTAFRLSFLLFSSSSFTMGGSNSKLAQRKKEAQDAMAAERTKMLEAEAAHNARQQEAAKYLEQQLQEQKNKAAAVAQEAAQAAAQAAEQAAAQAAAASPSNFAVVFHEHLL
jgi:Na+-translocating ferredoxin:NAD+ oxidoreductase RnfC subunit